MNLKHITGGALLAFALAIVIVVPSVEAPPVKVITPAEYEAVVGPLLDQVAAACGEALDLKKFRLDQLPAGTVVCEAKAVKVAAP